MARAGLCVYLEQLIPRSEGAEQRSGAGRDLVVGLGRVEHVFTKQQRWRIALVPLYDLELQRRRAVVGDGQRPRDRLSPVEGLIVRSGGDLDLRFVVNLFLEGVAPTPLRGRDGQGEGDPVVVGAGGVYGEDVGRRAGSTP